MSEEDLEKLLRSTRAYQDGADMAIKLLAMEQLSAKIEKTSVELAQEVLRVREEAEQVRGQLDMEVKAVVLSIYDKRLS